MTPSEKKTTITGLEHQRNSREVVMAVMVPIIISHDGAVDKDAIKRWNNFAVDIQVDWVRMAQNVLRHNMVIVESSSTRAVGSRKHGG